MRDKSEKKFIFSHLFFLLSLAVVYFIPYVARTAGDTFLPPQESFVRFYIIAVLSVIFICYMLLLHYFKEGEISVLKNSSLSVFFWSTTILVFLFLCASHAVLSSDLYEYSIRGRMAQLYGINPYLNTPFDIKSDMFYPLIFWKQTPECYGPVWVAIGGIHTLLFRNDLVLTMFTHKVILMGFLFLSAYFFYKICRELEIENPEILSLAFLFNPLILVMTIVDGHNEIAMVCFMLAAFYFLFKSKYVISLILFALAVQVKFVYILIAPMFLLYIIFGPGAKSIRSRIFEIIIGGVLSAALIALLWVPFGWKSVLALVDYYRDLNALFWSDSLPYIIYWPFEQLKMFGAKQVIANICSAIFLGIYGYCLYRFVRVIRIDRQAIFTYTGLMILGLLFTNYTPFQPWYLLWVIPLILLGRVETKHMLVLFLSYFLIMTFWKRMSVLAIPMVIGYFYVLASPRIKEKLFKELDLKL